MHCGLEGPFWSPLWNGDLVSVVHVVLRRVSGAVLGRGVHAGVDQHGEQGARPRRHGRVVQWNPAILFIYNFLHDFFSFDTNNHNMQKSRKEKEERRM